MISTCRLKTPFNTSFTSTASFEEDLRSTIQFMREKWVKWGRNLAYVRFLWWNASESCSEVEINFEIEISLKFQNSTQSLFLLQLRTNLKVFKIIVIEKWFKYKVIYIINIWITFNFSVDLQIILIPALDFIRNFQHILVRSS